MSSVWVLGHPLSSPFLSDFSGLFWPAIARQVFHCIAEAVLYNDAVHSGLGHPQLLPNGALRLSVLPQVHHTLALQDIVLLGLQAGAGFCGANKWQTVDTAGGSGRMAATNQHFVAFSSI